MVEMETTAQIRWVIHVYLNIYTINVCETIKEASEIFDLFLLQLNRPKYAIYQNKEKRK